MAYESGMRITNPVYAYAACLSCSCGFSGLDFMVYITASILSLLLPMMHGLARSFSTKEGMNLSSITIFIIIIRKDTPFEGAARIMMPPCEGDS